MQASGIAARPPIRRAVQPVQHRRDTARPAGWERYPLHGRRAAPVTRPWRTRFAYEALLIDRASVRIILLTSRLCWGSHPGEGTSQDGDLSPPCWISSVGRDVSNPVPILDQQGGFTFEPSLRVLVLPAFPTRPNASLPPSRLLYLLTLSRGASQTPGIPASITQEARRWMSDCLP